FLAHLAEDRRNGGVRAPFDRRGADPVRPHLRVRHRSGTDPHHRRLAGRRHPPFRRRPRSPRVRQLPRRAARNAQGAANMTAGSPLPPRKSVPAPKLGLAQRTRDVLTSPNAIRVASVAVFIGVWVYFGRQMDPIFMAPPSAIFAAAVQLVHSGALRKALIESLWPFSVGMALTIVVGIVLGIVIAQWRLLEYIL